MKNTIIGITFVNRFIMFITVLFLLIGLANDSDALIIGLLLSIGLGAIQVLSSLILLYHRNKFKKELKNALIIYILLVIFYFMMAALLLNISGSPEGILIIIPVILAFFLTVIIEKIYYLNKKGKLI